MFGISPPNTLQLFTAAVVTKLVDPDYLRVLISFIADPTLSWLPISPCMDRLGPKSPCTHRCSNPHGPWNFWQQVIPKQPVSRTWKGAQPSRMESESEHGPVVRKRLVHGQRNWHMLASLIGLLPQCLSTAGWFSDRSFYHFLEQSISSFW